MLLCKYFVLLHFPRTGGTFLRETLARHLPENSDTAMVPGHGTINEIPREYESLPKLGFIRNPWDWYVSVYTGWQGMKQHRPEAFEGHILEKISYSGNTIDFESFLVGVLNEQHYGNGMGPLNWAYINMYGLTKETIGGNIPGLKLARFENLRQETIDFMEDNDISMSKALAEAIRSDPPINGFKRKSYRDYYNNNLINLVYDKHREIIDKYNYEY